jgi:hypothetical protein
MTDPQLRDLSNEALAMRSVLRALVRVQARRSPASLSELLDALDRESQRIGCRSGEAAPVADPHPACAALEGYIEHAVEEATAC